MKVLQYRRAAFDGGRLKLACWLYILYNGVRCILATIIILTYSHPSDELYHPNLWLLLGGIMHVVADCYLFDRCRCF